MIKDASMKHQVTGNRKDTSGRHKASFDRKKRKKSSGNVRETTEAIFIALLAALVLRAFVVQAFRIPTGSMKDTLLVGDFLLVNKFVYGVRTPDSIPFVNAQIPFFRLPAFKQPRNGDVVVFKYPKDETLDYTKRCIGVAGETIEIRDNDVFINGEPEGEKVKLGQNWDPEEARYVELTRTTTPFGKSYVVRHYADSHESFHLPPLLIPKAGMTIRVNFHTMAKYGDLIKDYEGVNASVRNDKLYIDGNPVSEYTFKHNYYFMMGDNRDNSSDSRVWGMLPEQNVVGEALLIYFSWNKASEYWNLLESVRWPRILSLIR